MTTEKAFEHVKLAALEVKAALIDIDENIQLSVSEVENITLKMSALSEQLTIYKYLKTQKELSPSFNIHLKVMEKVEQKSEQDGEQIQSEIENNHEEIRDIYNLGRANHTKKIELGLNDKFRIINELFNQNATEFNLVVDQLNSIDSKENSETYLTELMNLYKWKNDHELTIKIFQLNEKRFK